MSSYSFRVPQHLLHSLTEPQWLPRSKDVTEPRVTALERQEQDRIAELQTRILPAAPEPLGVVATEEKKTAPPVDWTTTGARNKPLFWDAYRDQVAQVRASRRQQGQSGGKPLPSLDELVPRHHQKESRMDVAFSTGRTD